MRAYYTFTVVLQDCGPVEIVDVDGIAFLSFGTVDACVTFASPTTAGSIHTRLTYTEHKFISSNYCTYMAQNIYSSNINNGYSYSDRINIQFHPGRLFIR